MLVYVGLNSFNISAFICLLSTFLFPLPFLGYKSMEVYISRSRLCYSDYSSKLGRIGTRQNTGLSMSSLISH